MFIVYIGLSALQKNKNFYLCNPKNKNEFSALNFKSLNFKSLNNNEQTR
jgi:hypothetical protein